MRTKFQIAFESLTGYAPLPWQERLFHRFMAGDLPDACDLPTGLGKTMVIPIWLIALAAGAKLPRRLVYVVDRRTVVDQATAVTEKLRPALLSSSDEVVCELRERLQVLSAFGRPLAISTLRGEYVDNREWQIDPAGAAIIIGTIDMIGSKLLFSGYGDSRYGRAHHAGLIGQDTFIVLDEVHLSPAFSALLRSVAAEQQKLEAPRGIRVQELSATAPRDNGKTFSLLPENEHNEVVRARLYAEKRLMFHPSEDLCKKIVERALRHEPTKAKVLVYVRTVKDAQAIFGTLNKKAGTRVALLTGTLRGYERDQLVRENPVYRALLHHESVPETVYLVSTSAGEVGIDLDADHLVCDLVPLDSMIQRLGRCNRRGGRVASVDVVECPPKKEDPALTAPRTILARLPAISGTGYNASVKEVSTLLSTLNTAEKQSAFNPQPPVVLPNDILWDLWSLTSVRGPLPGRLEVAPYLHGLTNEPPETFVAWRQEVSLLAEADDETIEQWFGACRIKSHERLHDLSSRVFKELEKIKARCPDLRAIVLNERGEAACVPISELDKEAIEYHTIVLPAEVGGLKQGFLDGAWEEPALDVADSKRVHLHVVDNHFQTLQLGTDLVLEGECDSARAAATEVAQDLRVSQLVCVREADSGEADYLLLLTERGKIETPQEQTVAEHTEHVIECIRRICAALELGAEITKALVLAAQAHDWGKARIIWQRAVYNTGEVPLAKSGLRGMISRILSGYRHEFGSILDASESPEINTHPERDLILHLIAAHHGHGRPHFELRAYNCEKHTLAQNEEAAHEGVRRFARLQARFGRWGLAWLESLLRCADAVASGGQS